MPRAFVPPLLPALLALAGCPSFDIDLSEEAAAAVRAQDLGTLPYHPLVYHLDLSILAYQTYSQSLAWPFDPYYEDLASPDDGRNRFMASVRDWAETTGAAQLADDPGAEAFRGPGLLSGFDDNPLHDPIIYQYSRIHPWSSTVSNADGTWAEYLVPPAITDPIAELHLCTRTSGAPEGQVTVEQLTPGRDDAGPGATDLLLAIEGGTGDKGEEGQPASRSLMAVVLVRSTGAGYDLHIAFRGSRSGSGLRAALGALSTTDAEGNPDWITDLGTRFIDAPSISGTGQVFRGMATSMQSIVPQLFGCLDTVLGQERETGPEHIYLTGHSLGGALAQHLASAVLLGEEFGPGRDGLPSSLQDWPWEQLKLITYGAPRVGDEDWATELTTEALESQYFVNRAGSRWDAAAIGVTDLEIIPRLLDPAQPAAYRVLIPTDPITAEAGSGARHVGQSVYLAIPTAADAGALPDFDDHEPANERALMLETLRDRRLPDTAWLYHEMDELNPGRVEDEAGTEPEVRRLAAAVRDYNREQDNWFDEEAFDASLETFVQLLE